MYLQLNLLVFASIAFFGAGFHLIHKHHQRPSCLKAENVFQRLYEMMNPRNVYLVGMMGSGKSSVAKILSAKLNYECTDIDCLIQSEIGMPIAEYFTQQGEARFREMETAILSSLANNQCQVVATGGGLVLREENWKFLRRGIVVFLNPSISTIMDRLMKIPTELSSRPLLQKGPDPRRTLEDLMKKRQQHYLQADIHVPIGESQSLHDVADIVAQRIVSHMTVLQTG
jgi:shikimate kinase